MTKKELTFYEPAIIEAKPAPGQRAVPKQRVTEAVYPTHQQPQKAQGKPSPQTPAPAPPEAPPEPPPGNGRFAVKGLEEFDGIPVRVLPPTHSSPPSPPPSEESSDFSFDLGDDDAGGMANAPPASDGQGGGQGGGRGRRDPRDPSWANEAYSIPTVEGRPEPHPLDIIFDQIRNLAGEGQAYPRREDFTKEFKDRAGGGRMFLLPLDDDRICIIRPLRRIEWMKVMEKFQTQRGYTDEDAKHEVVKACLFWPKIADVRWGQMEAGLVETLYTAIRQQSFFLSEEQVNAITMKL